MGRQECWEEGRGLECTGRAGEKPRVLSFPEEVAGSLEGVDTCEWSWSRAWGTWTEVSVIPKFPRAGVWGTWGGLWGPQVPEEGNRVPKRGPGTVRGWTKEGRGMGGAECRTHAALRTHLPPGRRGAVPGRTARGHCASGRSARTRPQRRAAHNARDRRSATPRRLRAARPGPTGPRPPGGAGRPHAPAGSSRALQEEGSGAEVGSA